MADVLLDEVSVTTNTAIRMIDRNTLREQRQRTSVRKTGFYGNVSVQESRTTWPSKMKEFLLYQGESMVNMNRLNSDISNFDEDEIDLDIDDDTGNNDCINVVRLPLEKFTPTNHCSDNEPQLLILGTGCASPSPYLVLLVMR